MKTLLALPRVCWIGIASIYSCLSVFFIRMFFIFAPSIRSARFSQKYMLSHWGRQILKMFRVKVEKIGEPPPDDTPFIIVSNHVSYLDIGVVPQITNVTFLSRHEVAYVPFVGWGAAIIGVHFVDRRSSESRAKGKKELRRKYENGVHVALFVEGTTSDGSDVLPFKKSAFEMGLDIVPCAIKYKTDTGYNPAWYADVVMWPHAVEGLNQKRIDCRVKVFPLMKADDYPDFDAYQIAVRDKIRAWVIAPWGEEDDA